LPTRTRASYLPVAGVLPQAVWFVLFEPTRKNVEPASRKGDIMPERQTIQRARQKAKEGKAPTTQAGEFVAEEVHHIREGKHGARSAKQAIAIGFSKARRAGVKLPPPRKSRVAEKNRRSAASASRAGQQGKKPSPKRSQASLQALKHEGRSAASHQALSKQARSAAAQRRKKK
jgi:hypothetical protein